MSDLFCPYCGCHGHTSGNCQLIEAHAKLKVQAAQLDKYDQVIVMLNRELDSHISDPTKLELSKDAWKEAVARVEAYRKGREA